MHDKSSASHASRYCASHATPLSCNLLCRRAPPVQEGPSCKAYGARRGYPTEQGAFGFGSNALATRSRAMCFDSIACIM